MGFKIQVESGLSGRRRSREGQIMPCRLKIIQMGIDGRVAIGVAEVERPSKTIGPNHHSAQIAVLHGPHGPARLALGSDIHPGVKVVGAQFPKGARKIHLPHNGLNENPPLTPETEGTKTKKSDKNARHICWGR